MTAADDWPHTTRLLPWMLALLLVVIWLVPSEAITFPVPLPLDATPDRALLLAILVVSLATTAARNTFGRGPRAAIFGWAMLVFVVVAILSLAVNAKLLASVGEMDQGTKKLLLLLGNVALFYTVVTVVRPSELRAFVKLSVGLGTIAAVGVLWEYRTDYNVFYDLAHTIFSPVATVANVPGLTLDGREDTFGPTQHGLAITTMLTFMLPFAVLGMLETSTRTRKALYAIAVVLLFAAGLATLRKTSMIAPVAALLVLVAYRPRQMLRLAPFGLVVVIAIHVLAPEAIGNVGAQFANGFFDAGTTRGRTSDYEAIAPDIASHPLFGRGFGTIDPARSDTYRILDNQYLGQLVQVGFLGLAAYLALLAAALQLAHRTALRAGDPRLRVIGLGALAGFVGFGVANALFDLLSFWEVPYLFFFIAGLCTVAATDRLPAARPVRVQAQPA